MATDGPVAYLDSSAIMKLVVREAESPALLSTLAGSYQAAASELAIVEVGRVVGLARDPLDARGRWQRVLDDLLLLSIDANLLHQAAAIADRRIRSLDAIHLASALRIEPDVLITYDTRMAEAAGELALRVAQPGR